jgi:kynurenine formamidase
VEDVILPGVVINVRGFKATDQLELSQLVSVLTLPDSQGTIPIRGKAVLFNFGWDRQWSNVSYNTCPSLSHEVAEFLANEKAGLVGVDTPTLESVGARSAMRSVYSILLANDVLIVENLKGLDQLLFFKNFRFFAVPLRIAKVPAMPIRAFAEVEH